MRLISIGDLVTDFYYQDNKLLGISGGMTSHNIIANLSQLNLDTTVFGVCGNDKSGLAAIRSLKDLKIDTSNINILDNINTRCFHVSLTSNNNSLSINSKKRCPFCNQKKWYEESLIDVEKILNLVKKEDILIFDNLNKKNQEIINNTTNIKLLDLGQFSEFENLNEFNILKQIKGKFKIININERVYEYLRKRFSISNEIELYKLFDIDLIIITKGKNGATFLYNNNVYTFTSPKIIDEIDPTGAGDAFFCKHN